MAHDGTDPQCTSAPFEGPEKLLEIWFAPSAAFLPDVSTAEKGRYGLRKVKRDVWEEMLSIVKCKVLSVVKGKEIDAYLLSESSLFISPHRLILKTCGTTLNLLGLPRILEIARIHASLPSVYRCFYSRKSFMFPERQQGPHKEWKDEVQFLDGIFTNGSAYTVGKVNGDHWLLYLTSPEAHYSIESLPSSPITSPTIFPENGHTHTIDKPSGPQMQDYTIEILMSQLSPEARAPFLSNSNLDSAGSPEMSSNEGLALSSSIGISDLFPPHLTTLDAYSFTPCGYSSNALIKWGDAVTDEDFFYSTQQGCHNGGEGYYSIHVTPEAGWSYASFECNVPLCTKPSCQPDDIPDLKTLIGRVVNIFQPERLTLTVFVSSQHNNAEDEERETAAEAAHRAFKAALMVLPQTLQKSSAKLSPAESNCAAENGQERKRLYARTDKINYEFGGYDLAFASFELR